MGKLLAILCATAGLVSAGSANATAYDFSYDFGIYAPGNTVTGSFTGAGSITDITDISNITLNINGVTVAGPITAYFYNGAPGANCGSCFSLMGATVSSDPTQEDFLFGNSDTLSGLTRYFYIIPGWVNGGPGDHNIATQGLGPIGNIPTSGYNGDYIPANFSVVAVPEPATWAMMLVGLGMIGFAARARGQKVKITYA